MESNCKNCKHWSGTNAALPTGRGLCYIAKGATLTMYASGGLLTSPEFGCNQHAAKPIHAVKAVIQQ